MPYQPSLFDYDYSQGMPPRPSHWDPIPVDEMNVGNLSSELPTIDTSNPQVMKASMFNWPSFGGNTGLESNRPSGIDTPMNYQDQIRTLPGGNYQGWKDRIMDTDLMVNQEYEDSLRDINTNPRWDDTTTSIHQTGEPFFAENRKNPIKNLIDPEVNWKGYQRGPNDFNINNFGISGILQGLKDQFKYRGATEEAWDPNTNRFVSAEEQDKQNALGGYYSDAARNQRRQRARVVNMMKRRDADKGYSEKNLQKLIDLGYGPQEEIITTTVGDNINQGGGGGSEAAFTQTSPGGISQAQSRAARGGMGGWRLAQGGRAGYANGEFVDEDVNIQGPGFDVNENIEMASAQDPMDALNDMSLMIFKKPFDQLNEDERQILFEMANDQAAGPSQGEGIASLV